jgi:hypothetical protein
MKDSSLYGRVFKNEAEALVAYQRHMDERDMLAQYQENEKSSVKEPKTSFWSYFFSKAGKINEQLFVQIANLPEWYKIAEKKGSETFLVVDEPTLEILKSKSLPVDSGENGSYFNFIKNSGYKFVTIEDLINKLPEKNKELCEKIYDKIDNFVKIDALSMASIRDFAKVLVSMVGNKFVKNIGGDNRNGMLIEKEPDILVNSGDVDSSPMDFSMNTKLLLVRGVLVPTDMYKTTLLIDVETTHGQKNITQQHDELSKIFCNDTNGNVITGSVEVFGRRGESLYYTHCLREAYALLEDMEKYFIIDKNKIDTNSSAKMTRHLVSKLEQAEVLNYPALNPNPEYYIKAGKDGLGITGQIISRTWTNGTAGRLLGGQYIPISADISDIERIMNSTVTQEDLTFAMVRDLIKTTSINDTPSSGLELLTTNSTQAPINEKYTAPQTPPKTETNFFTFSLKKILALLASSSSLNNIPSSFAVAQQSLNNPSSQPTLTKQPLKTTSELKQTSAQNVLKARELKEELRR